MSRSLQPFQALPGVATPIESPSLSGTQRSTAVKNAQKWLIAPRIRRCRDLVALIIFVATMVVTIYLLGFDKKYKIKTTKKRISNYFTAADSFHRVCGTAEQPDPVAPSYAWLLSQKKQVYALCTYYQDLELNSIIPTTEDIASVSCSDLQHDDTYQETARVLMKKIGNLNSDMSLYQVGYKTDSMVCVQSADITSDCLPQMNTDTVHAEYVCHHEFNYMVQLVQITLASNPNPDLQPVKDAIASISGQFLTVEQYNALRTAVEIHDAQLKFMSGLCSKMPSDQLQGYYSRYEPTTFKFDNVQPQCIINFQKAIKENFGSVEMVSVYLEYLTMAFDQPVATAIQELDQSWKNFAISIAFSIGLTLVYQLLMYFTARVLIYLAIIGLMACVFYFIYFAFDYAVELTDLNQLYYAQYGVQNMKGQVNQVLIYILCAILIILGLLILSMSCLLFNLAGVIANAVAVIRGCFKHVWTVAIVPLVFVVIVFVHMAFYVYVIILHTTTGQFNAKSSTFVFVDDSASESPSYDSVSIVVLIFYVIQLFQGVFLCLGITEYVIGSAVIQYYFARDQKMKVFRTFKWALLNFGSLIAEAYATTILVWLRPIFQLIVEKQPYLPENSFLRSIVKFSRWYVSMCSNDTIFSLGMTGQSHLKAAKTWRSFMIKDKTVTNTIGTALSLFNILGKLFISLASWILMSILSTYNSDLQTVQFIWVNILSFGVSFVTASFITNITTYIMNALLFCWNYECVVGANKIVCEPDELKKLRTLIASFQSE